MTRLTLWLRAGSDGMSCGGDPAAHHLFMLMLWKAELDPSLKFDVKTVNEARPPQEFKDVGLRRTPALQIDEDTAYSVEDEIIEQIDRYGPPRPSTSEADHVTSDIFRAFAFFIKGVQSEPTALLSEFQRIEHYLQENSHRFLCSDQPSHLDCQLLPRLHSIRIASKALNNFDIPSNLSNLWRYMKNGYELECFAKSCASDQEIVLYWSDRPDTPGLSSSKRAELARQKPYFTRTILTDADASL
ncbi:hypothetical protein Q1695_010763 [Nippostrongylus brasiliensis]|nr:hypothetical protein Q1695_010763 [Nippostrongylus brasiliensis]